MSEETETAGAEAPVETTAPEAIAPEAPVVETAKEEAPVEAKEAETEDEQRPKRESGYARMKRRALLAEAQLANARLRDVGTTASQPEKNDEPQEADFNGDWGAYIAARAAHAAAKGVKGTLDADKKAAQEARAAELNREVLEDFEERKEEFKAKATDFDEVVERFVSGGGKFSDAVRDLVIDSDVGPQLAYHLAKNPALANKLNAMTPLQAAKEVGRLEDTLSKPSPKSTKAPPPVNALKGAAGPPSNWVQSDDMDEFAKNLMADLAKRSGRR